MRSDRSAGRLAARLAAVAGLVCACAWQFALATPGPGAAPVAPPELGPPATRATDGKGAKTPARAPAPVDINSASIVALKALPGIDESHAQRIVAGRPYRTKTDLVERHILPSGVYLSLKGRLIAKPVSGPPRPRTS